MTRSEFERLSVAKHRSISPVVPIELDRTRNIMFDIFALEALEERLDLPSGITLDPAFWGDPKGRFKRIRAALWAGLLHEDAELTFEQVNEMLRGFDPGVLIGSVMQAWGMSRPEPKEGDAVNPQMPEPSPLPGLDSGVSPDTSA